MLFAAKSAAPFASQRALRRPELDKAAEGAKTLFTTPPGYLLSDSLVLALTEHSYPIIWLRIEPEDRDPATLLLSLIAAAQKIRPGIGTQTLHQMRQCPGPVAGWPSLFKSLACEFVESVPDPFAIVLEQVHHLKQAQGTLSLLGINFVQNLPRQIPCILISQEPLPSSVVPPKTNFHGVADLRVDPQVGLSIVKETGSGLSKGSVSRFIHLVEGRIVPLAGLLSAEETLGAEFVQHAIRRSKNAKQLLAIIVRASLSTANPDYLEALALAMHLEYSHPDMLEAVLGKKIQLVGPWIQPLSDGWSRVRRVWQTPLYSTLRTEIASIYSALHHAADYLVEQGALDRAVPLYLNLKDTDSAARVIAGIAAQLTDLGQWETLDHWLKQLPSETIQDWPWLWYTRGEIFTLQGRLEEARKIFAEAVLLFSAQYEDEGACQSLLAESAVAAWQGDVENARSYALTADAKASAAGLKWFHGWAAWQLGCLNTTIGDMETALSYFSQAFDSIHNPLIAGLFQQVEALALKQHELHRQSDFHRQAYLNLLHAEEETSTQLKSLTSSPPENLAGLLSVYGWSNTPMVLKLSAPTIPGEEAQAIEEHGLFAGLLRTAILRLRSKKIGNSLKGDGELPSLEFPLRILPEFNDDLPAAKINKSTASSSLTGDHFASTLPGTILAPVENITGTHQQNMNLPKYPLTPGSTKVNTAIKEDKSVLRVTACLLGSFRVSVNDHNVEKWPGRRGKSVLKYLLANLNEEISRDVLMDVFWPDSAPDSARNNLNVAMHNLRQAFSHVCQEPVVIFKRGNYRMNPEINIWTDIDEFERHFQASRQLESAGQIPDASNEYEIAANLYQGDFLADDPYDEWPIITRERLRVMYLETLDHLSRIYFSQGQYAACAALCQRILERDDCREDAHCRLMRSYSRQGQHNLALRQYQTCVEALRTQLDVDPEATTIQLADRIRRHEQV